MSVLWALPLGLVIGTTLGALGAGGGILTVPALVYLLGQDARAATTGSLLIVGVSALVGLLPHHMARNVRWRQGILFGALGLLGSWPGSYLAALADPDLLLVGFALLMLVVAALMVRRLSSTSRPAAVESPHLTRRRLAVLAGTAMGIGFLTGFFGVGGGFAVVPALTLVLGFPMPQAVGTSLLVIALNSGTALTARLTAGAGDLEWGLIVLFALGSVIGSLLGARIVARANHRHLSIAFVAMLVAVAGVMLVQGVPAIL
ncbi:MAG: sulfite exporter TauE/SafE family protein [Actinomycetales bacterium]|nr:sulfite exporter TauE/SafE family protein [Actinomycetales bacterium]